MSSFPNQPVVEDIVSAFETTQNQSWSLFNDKLGGIPIKDCKKKDNFKSENPIALSDEDIPVFGLVPRLEKLMLVSCNKCSMVVKRDCIHHHYNRRHKDPENDFSLERFILPNVKTNKHKKQKISVRKLPEKKIIGDNSDPVVQEIKTEFDLLEFERLSEEKIKQDNKIQYVNDCNANLTIENCNSGTSCGVFDWNLKPCTQSLSHFVDQKINDEITVCDKESPVLPVPSVKEKPTSNTCIDSTDDVNNISDTINHIMINCVTNSNEMLTKSLSSNKKTKSKVCLDLSSILSRDNEEKEYNEIYDDPKSCKEQTKSTTKITFSNLMNDQSDINNKYLENNTSTLNQSSVASVGIEGETKLMSTNNSNVSNDNGKHKINGDSGNLMSQLNRRLLDNKEQASFIPLYKHLQVTPDKSSSYAVPNCHQSSALLGNKDEISQHYLNVENNKKIKECNENSKTVVHQLPAELQKNEGHIIYTPTNKNCVSKGDENSRDSGTFYHSSTESSNLKKGIISTHKTDFFNDLSDQENESNGSSKIKCHWLPSKTQTFSPNSSIIPFGTEKNIYLAQSNEYTVTSNENSDNDVTSNDESSSVELLSLNKKFKPLTEHLISDTVDYDYGHDSSEDEYFQLGSGNYNTALISLSSNFNYNLESESDEEETDEINDNCKNNFKKTKLLPRNDYSDGINSESSSDSYDQLSASSLGNKDESKSIEVTENSNILTDNSCHNSEICEQSLSTSDNEDEETKCMTADSYSDCTSEDSSNDSDTSNEQLNTELQDVTKDTKSTQTNFFLNHLNHKPFVDPITRIDESIAESLGVMNDDTKCTQTVIFECDDCYKITEDLLDNYFPLNANVEVGDVINTCDNSNVQIPECSINSFTPISSSAQIINNTIIPTTAQDNDYGNNNISMSSHSDLSSSQKYFTNPESQYDHSPSRLVQNPNIENNEKHYTSEFYANRHKHTENILLRNLIMKGSTPPYMDKNHAMCRDRLKKAIGEKTIYSKNCMKIPYEYDNIEAKLKKSMKRRLGGKVADGKENHSIWISESFQKRKRIVFVTRKNTYSDESDNNDNVHE